MNPDVGDAPGTPLQQIRHNITDQLYDGLYAMQQQYTQRVDKPQEWSALLAELTAMSAVLGSFCQGIAQQMADAHDDPGTILEIAALAANPIVLRVPDTIHHRLVDEPVGVYASEMLDTVDMRLGGKMVADALDGDMRVIIAYDEDPARPELILYGGADDEQIAADLCQRGLVPREVMWTPSPHIADKYYSVGEQLFDGYGLRVFDEQEKPL